MEKNMQKGRSMIEMLGVLAVVGVLTVTGFAMVDKMRKNQQTTRVMDDIAEMAQKTRQFLREYDGDYCRIAYNCYVVEKMNNEKMVPSGMEYDSENKKFVNLDDVQFSVNYTNHAGTGDYTKVLFKLYIDNATEEMCLKIATANWGNDSSGYANIITIGSQTIKGDVSIEAATAYCAVEPRPQIVLNYR